MKEHVKRVYIDDILVKEVRFVILMTGLSEVLEEKVYYLPSGYFDE